MNKTNTVAELAKALSLFQGEMKAVAMNAENPFLKNKYADLGAIILTSKEVLAKHGLSFTQLATNDGDKVGVETVLMHSSGEWISNVIYLPVGVEKGKNDAQVAGSVLTYLRRYSLSAILGIYTEEDTDAADKKQEAEAKKTEEGKKKAEVTKSVKDTITALCVELGGKSNEKLMEVLNSLSNRNFNKIYDEKELADLLVKLETMKKEKSNA